MTEATSHSLFFTTQDGLKLHVRHFGARGSDHLPVVCLPGLTRTAEDFTALATALATDAERPRRVVALDSRGRGQSDYDRNADNYSLPVELGDVIAMLTAIDVGRAIFVGSSRGGILTMLLGAARPSAIAGAVLNDIGPVIEVKGLMRIKSYVGKLPQPRSHEEGAEVLRRLFESQFPKLSPADWLTAAKRTWREENERLIPTYDVKLAGTVAGVDPEHPLPPMWMQFDALARVPMMVVRGANSDLLSAETVAAMLERRPQLEAIEVPDQGHTPLLAEPEMIARIADFAARCDGGPLIQPAPVRVSEPLPLGSSHS
jgi:pimeloyl-ACP methyl ester carboxylesterase